MFRNLLLSGLTASLLPFTAQAQQHTCASHTLTQRLLAEQGLSTDVRASLPAIDGAARGGGSSQVSVVVHVVYNNTAENVSDAAIQAIINELNQDYSQTNADLSGVRSTFTGVIGNVGIQFCLAQFDPNGAATTGITRTQTTETWFDPDTETNAMKSAPLGKAPWDPTRYLNIWVCDITSGATGGTITVGYAYLPTGGVVGSNIDGLVIDYNYGMDVGARTATHEIGHYFGLMHTFDDGGSCVNSDGFADTPTSNSPTFSCSNTNLVKCGVLTQYENFMDYSNCTAMFTDQQAAYMQGILNGTRASLLTSTACGTPTGGYCIPTSSTGTAEGDFINSVLLGTINNANSGGTTAPSYTDYSATLSTNLNIGTAYTIAVQSGTYQPDNYAVWIDYDQDESFEETEKLGEFTTDQVSQTGIINFTVPVGATLGNTRMRVRGVYHDSGEPSPTDPCFAYAYGETEDYGITILGPVTGYCIPTSLGGPADGDFINGVQLGTINNTNTGGEAGPSYNDYTAQSTALVRGDAYNLAVQGGNYQPDRYAAWIDYDQDDTFEANEKLGEFATTATLETQNIPFTVPVGAPLGSTRMRVRGVFVLTNPAEPSPLDPCYNYVYGETEDYTVDITTSTGTPQVSGGNYTLFPNPATDAAMLRMPNAEPATLHLLDLQGRTVRTWRTNGTNQLLELGEVADGHYLLSVLQRSHTEVIRMEVLHRP